MRTQRLTEYARAIIISPEFLVVAGLCAVGIWKPPIFQHVGAALRDAEGELAWTIVVAPGGMLWICLKLSHQLTHPEGRRADLVKWPDYWRFLLRIYVALGMSALATMVMFISLYLVHFVSTFAGGLAAVASGAVSVTSLWLVALARFKLEAILDGAVDP